MNFTKAFQYAEELKQQLHKLKGTDNQIPNSVYPYEINEKEFGIRLDFNNAIHQLVAEHIIYFCGVYGLSHEHTPIAYKRSYIIITDKV